MNLPGGDRVQIDDLKIRGYLLSPTHPVGRFKARVFAAAGFGESTAELFVSELRRIAASGKVEETEDIEFGRKYTVPGELRGPSGVVQVLTVWIEDRTKRRRGWSQFIRGEHGVRSSRHCRLGA